MPSYHPPDYIDNTSDEQMLMVVLNAMLHDGEASLDVASGFFEPDVWRLLAGGLQKLTSFRLLLGRAPEIENPDAGDGAIDLRRFYRDKLRTDLESLPMNRGYAQLVDELTAFLQQDHVEVRFYGGTFLHAKAYIMPHLAIVGSSNFTPSGMTRRAELNVTRREQAVIRDLRDNWFAGMWADSVDQKQALIEMLIESKFSGQHWTPQDVFIKVLYEYFRDRLLPEAPEMRIGVELASFQQEGLHEAIRLIDRHGGVIVSDAVGLGKTYIGMGLLEHYVLGKRSKGHIPKGLVICPAQLRDLVWEPKLNEYGIKAEVLSQESLGRESFDWRAYNHYDVILIDESHNFRNPGTGRYGNLMRLLATGKPEKAVILMTATPINNSIWDLYHQLSLITRGQDAFFREYGIRNLKGFFREVEDGGVDIFALLEQVMVRRSRQDVKQRQAAGEEIRLPGKGVIHFPERQLHSVTYDLEATYSGFYERLVSRIDSLALISFNIEQYRKGDIDQDIKHKQQYSNALVSILKTLYLKRLESSLVALQLSIESQRRFQQRFFDLLINHGRLLDAANNRKLLALEAVEDDDTQIGIDAIITELPEADIRLYNMRLLRDMLQQDMSTLDTILDDIDQVQGLADESQRDAKLAEVKALLSGELAGRKVLIFSYYRDTALYVYDALCHDPAWQANWSQPPVIEVIHGTTDPLSREQIVRRFAPEANKSDEGEGRLSVSNKPPIDILISTDVLSEGQNLQDAGVIINYDLHWTPIRMIQRAGRIDRLGTSFETLDIYNCFPQSGLESLLGLVEKLQDRIRDIDRTVGLDASVLGETISTRSLNQLRRLQNGDGTLIDELERDTELVSTDEMKFPLMLYLQQQGMERIRAIPLGIGSGALNVPHTPTGIFFAFQVHDRHYWRLYTSDNDLITDKRRLYRYLGTAAQERRSMPAGFEIFDALEQATADVLREANSVIRAQSLPPKKGKLNIDLENALAQHSLLHPETSAESDELVTLAEKVHRTLQEVPLEAFRRDKTLKAILAQRKDDPIAVLHDLDQFFIDNDLYREVAPRVTLQRIEESDVRLIAYEVFG